MRRIFPFDWPPCLSALESSHCKSDFVPLHFAENISFHLSRIFPCVPFGDQASTSNSVVRITKKLSSLFTFRGRAMRHIKIAVLSIAILSMTGCSSTGPQYTKDDYKTASRYCLEGSNADKKARSRQWFTRWLSCSQERLMPIEIAYYPTKEKDIRQMYERLFVLAKDVDSGKSRVEPVYAEWDRMMDEIKMAPCRIKVVGRDGSEECLDL